MSLGQAPRKNHLDQLVSTFETFDLENPGTLDKCRFLVTFGPFGDSETEKYGMLFATKIHAERGAAEQMTDEYPHYPIALYDLDNMSERPAPTDGDTVEYEGERYVIVNDTQKLGDSGYSDAYVIVPEGKEGSLKDEEEVFAEEVTLIKRDDEMVDIDWLPARFPVAGTKTIVMFNSIKEN